MIINQLKWKNYIFDAGNVILTWEPKKILQTVIGDEPEAIDLVEQHIFKHGDWLALDRGELSEAEARANMQKRTELSSEQISRIFELTKSTLKPIESTINLITGLKQQGAKLYCLTNMSANTYHYVSRYDFWQYFDGIVVSAQVKMTKPDLNIYMYLLNQFSLKAKDTVFFDDMERNTSAAEKLGIKSIVYRNAEDAIMQLSA